MSLARFTTWGTSTWSDALDEIGVDGVVRGLTQRSGQRRFAGYAVTVRQSTGPLGTFEKSEIAVGDFIDAVGPDGVLLLDMGGAEISTFGGLAARATVQKGVAAAIIDGGCRDVYEIRESGFWLASRHVTPRTGKRRVRLESIGDSISVGGVSVHQGDLVVGDDTGVVVIPVAEIERVFRLAEQRFRTDQRVEEALQAGQSFKEAAASARYL